MLEAVVKVGRIRNLLVRVSVVMLMDVAVTIEEVVIVDVRLGTFKVLMIVSVTVDVMVAVLVGKVMVLVKIQSERVRAVVLSSLNSKHSTTVERIVSK